MNLTTTFASLTAAALFCATPLQEALKPIDTPLSAAQAVHDFDAAAWAQGLRAPALDQRKQNYEELLQAALGSVSIQEQLRTWAADESDVELAWTAHLMLRELDSRAGARSFSALPFGSGGHAFPFADARATFDSLFNDLREFESSRSQRQSPMGPAPFGLIPHGIDWHDFTPGGIQKSSGVTVERGPDGVKVRVEQWVDGEQQTQTYAAETMEELLEAHPELKERVGSLGAPNFDAPQRRLLDGRKSPLSIDRDNAFPRGLRAMEPSLDQLGIRMLTPDMRSQSYEGVAADIGLQVVDVVPGSLADAIGIRSDELVISIAGRTIKSAEDVRAALKSCSLDKPIEVECVDASGKVRVRTWKPVAVNGATKRKAY